MRILLILMVSLVCHAAENGVSLVTIDFGSGSLTGYFDPDIKVLSAIKECAVLNVPDGKIPLNKEVPADETPKQMLARGEALGRLADRIVSEATKCPIQVKKEIMFERSTAIRGRSEKILADAKQLIAALPKDDADTAEKRPGALGVPGTINAALNAYTLSKTTYENANAAARKAGADMEERRGDLYTALHSWVKTADLTEIKTQIDPSQKDAGVVLDEIRNVNAFMEDVKKRKSQRPGDELQSGSISSFEHKMWLYAKYKNAAWITNLIESVSLEHRPRQNRR